MTQAMYRVPANAFLICCLVREARLALYHQLPIVYVSFLQVLRNDLLHCSKSSSNFNDMTHDSKIFKILEHLTIIPRARMGYESIAHEAEGRMSY